VVGLTWPIPPEISDAVLERWLFTPAGFHEGCHATMAGNDSVQSFSGLELPGQAGQFSQFITGFGGRPTICRQRGRHQGDLCRPDANCRELRPSLWAYWTAA
jgi:hypothetical protein